MAEGAFAPSASVVCALAEVHRDRKKRQRAYSPDEFNPYVPESERRRVSRGMPLTGDTLQLLAQAWGATTVA
jgi:hypothetical protein